MKKVLITGGSGFIGNAIVKKLYNKYEIVVLDNFNRQIHGNDFRKSYLYQNIEGYCEIIKGDVRDYEKMSEVLRGVDYVIHLASETGTGQSMYEIRRYADINITGTASLLDVILKSKIEVSKVILASSRAVYGEGMYFCKNHGITMPSSRKIKDMANKDFEVKCPFCGEEVELRHTTEDCSLTPSSFYAYTKFAQEKMLESMSPVMGIPYTILRYQNVYGKGQSLNNPYTGIISIFSKMLLQNQDINIFEDGRESRDFIHVSDAAAITCHVLENNSANNQCINVGSGKPVSVMEVAEMLKKLYSSKSELRISGDFRKGDIRHNVADISKAKNLCDFIPEYSLQLGLQDFSAWVMRKYEKGEISKLKTEFDDSLKEMKDAGMLISGQ